MLYFGLSPFFTCFYLICRLFRANYALYGMSRVRDMFTTHAQMPNFCFPITRGGGWAGGRGPICLSASPPCVAHVVRFSLLHLRMGNALKQGGYCDTHLLLSCWPLRVAFFESRGHCPMLLVLSTFLITCPIFPARQH